MAVSKDIASGLGSGQEIQPTRSTEKRQPMGAIFVRYRVLGNLLHSLSFDLPEMLYSS